jgi:hypothetical protein
MISMLYSRIQLIIGYNWGGIKMTKEVIFIPKPPDFS